MSRHVIAIEQIADSNSFAPAQSQREQIKQALRQKIQDALWTAQQSSPNARLQTIKGSLLAIQTYCGTVGKTFIMVEETITCDQYGLGGRNSDTATLFRGPSEDASVAICVTNSGSLLHRNGTPWTIYRNAGDVNPVDVH